MTISQTILIFIIAVLAVGAILFLSILEKYHVQDEEDEHDDDLYDDWPHPY